MISDYVRLRAADHLAPREVEQLREYLLGVLAANTRLPSRGRGLDWRTIAAHCDIDGDVMLAAANALRPGLEAMRRELQKSQARTPPPNAGLKDMEPPPRPRARPTSQPLQDGRPPGREPAPRRSREGHDGPRTFHLAFAAEMKRHGETGYSLSREMKAAGLAVDATTLRMWRTGQKAPAHGSSLELLAFLEKRWGLEAGYFRGLLPHPARAVRRLDIPGLKTSERRRLAWHLPDHFDRLDPARQEEILEWVRRVVVTGATDYRRYQAAALRHRFGVRFPEHQQVRRRRPADDEDANPAAGTMIAPASLAAEMSELLTFKTATLTRLGYRRRGVWGAETASQKVEHFGLMFGALAAAPTGPVRGLGVPRSHLTFALLAFPRVWDWYLTWRERRRGFYTAWEVDMLMIAVGLTNAETGWITQTPGLADRLVPILGLVSQEDIESAKRDWPAVCAELHRFALARSKEISRVARVHHDPFEPILPVLEAASPVGEYRKIADEIAALRPCPIRYPKAAAESSRAFLMIRFGLHLGFRQKNLRQLLVCDRNSLPSSERQLSERGCGELRWNGREGGWEVFVPAAAFKNSGSSFFGGRPFKLLLPDIGGLYAEIDSYIETGRPRLLAGARDPGTFFVKSVKSISEDAAYDQNTFYEAWRWIIQRYGIFNPYTGRGAIPGLLPHGPHSVRDVLATHVLKQTGSFEQASYAIQDTPDTVAQHYGRFLPQDKAAIAAQILNRAWEAA